MNIDVMHSAWPASHAAISPQPVRLLRSQAVQRALWGLAIWFAAVVAMHALVPVHADVAAQSYSCRRHH